MTDLQADPMTRETLIAEAERLLKDIEIYPGDRWPTDGRLAERGLFMDAMEWKEASPWVGGTLAAGHFIAASPRLVRDLLAALKEAQAAYESLLNDLRFV